MIAYDLKPASLAALTAGKVVAICIPDFLTQSEARGIAKAVTASQHFRFTGPGFTGLGPGSFSLPDALADYTASCAEIDDILACPLERLEASLGKLHRPVIDGEVALRPLTARRYNRSFVAPPHQDEDAHRYPWAGESQLGISLGLISPKAGGQIRVWNHAYDRDAYAERRLKDRFELDESLIPPATKALDCEAGKLVIINARKIHAIDPITDGARMSISGFLSVNPAIDPARGVRIWS